MRGLSSDEGFSPGCQGLPQTLSSALSSLWNWEDEEEKEEGTGGREKPEFWDYSRTEVCSL